MILSGAVDVNRDGAPGRIVSAEVFNPRARIAFWAPAGGLVALNAGRETLARIGLNASGRRRPAAQARADARGRDKGLACRLASEKPVVRPGHDQDHLISREITSSLEVNQGWSTSNMFGINY